jgi:hypothetical protein
LFDTAFITETFKKYRREGEREGHASILRANCGKCEGYGFYDWVTRLTDTGEKPTWNHGMTKPLIVKNENPISVIFLQKRDCSHTYYYVSRFHPSSITYRCERCHGTGLVFRGDGDLIPLTPEDDLPKQQTIITDIKDSDLNILRRVSKWKVSKYLKSLKLKSLKALSSELR